MLRTEPQLIEQHVATGELRLIFWPVINHGNPSVYSSVTMECIGRQDIEAAWAAHNLLFQNQSNLWSADLDFYAGVAEQVGVDRDRFVTCYGSQEAVDQIMKLDQIRRDIGIMGQPIFDVNGAGYLLGSQPYDVFADAIKVVQE